MVPRPLIAQARGVCTRFRQHTVYDLSTESRHFGTETKKLLHDMVTMALKVPAHAHLLRNKMTIVLMLENVMHILLASIPTRAHAIYTISMIILSVWDS